jgi:hypothetical protein
MPSAHTQSTSSSTDQPNDCEHTSLASQSVGKDASPQRVGDARPIAVGPPSGKVAASTRPSDPSGKRFSGHRARKRASNPRMPEQPSIGPQRAGADKHTCKQTGSSGRTTTEAPKPEPKKQQLRRLVARKSGATMDTLMEATGWQAHSVRAALSGLRKDGVAVQRRTNRKSETVYALGASDERA